MRQDLLKKYVLELLEKVQRVIGHSNFLRPAEQFDRPNVDLLQVNTSHSKDFLANVVGLLVDARDVNYLIWGEVRENSRCGPDSEIAEDCLTPLEGHTLEKIRL